MFELYFLFSANGVVEVQMSNLAEAHYIGKEAVINVTSGDEQK